MQILLHSAQFFDTLYLHASKMIKVIKTLIQPKVSTYVDAKIWTQKILLKYGKINS